MATSTKKPAAKKTAAAPTKNAATKNKGIVAKAKDAVSDVIASVAKPASAGLKAGASTFVHEVANTISGTKTAKEPKATPTRAKTLATKAAKTKPAAKKAPTAKKVKS